MKPLRILIVEDFQDHQNLMKEAIQDSIRNVEVVLADTGEACMLKLSENRFDLLIIDYSLYGINGMELLKHIVWKGFDIPIIMVTAFGSEDVAVEAMKLGAYEYVVKTQGYLTKLPALILKVCKEHRVGKEKAEIERKLVESELRYRTLVENIIDVVFKADKELNIISINIASQRIFEYSKDSMKKNLYELIYEEDKEKVVDRFEECFSSSKEYIEGLEFRIETGKKKIKHVELNARVHYGIGESAIEVEGVIRDVTERKKFEHKMSQMDKLNALGLQSSGIAHEFNNILGIILGYVDILKLKLKGTKVQVSDTINIIEKAAKDGAAIVDKIQQFSKTKPQFSGVIHADLVEVVEEVLEFTKPRWKSEAQKKGVEYTITKNNLDNLKQHIRCSPSELREVIVNIINNSLDAMPNGGKIEFFQKSKNGNIILSISDNGMGIKEDIKDKIFDPFFTTKGVKRSGLGMSVVFSIITRYGGDINIDSSSGEGTTVHLKIPLYSAKIKKKGKPKKAVSEYNANILVIEDEEVLLEMMKILLEKMGHYVFISQDANAGLKMYEKNSFDIVLCDLAMPKLNGWKVARYIKNLNDIRKTSKTPFILITGYELDTENLDYRKEGVDFILKKPLEFEQLYEMIDDLIIEKQQFV